MNVYKVLKDNIETIYLGKTDGTLLEIEREYFDFLPEVGDEVEVYGTEVSYIIKRKSTFQQTAESKPSNITALKVWGWICTGTSLLFLPLVFGIIGIILGYLVRSRGDKEQGTIIMIASIGTMILGVWIGALIGATTWG